ncbi:J domain-containing protein [Actinomadura parmotrematis]|uniref:J domain-containing protein n=1 Tax=Actinomadura parmotrematis TaxID=2864039 RepID=UPI00215D6E38|nr:J domain-containing protein [Actinomadura parmotrematis]
MPPRFTGPDGETAYAVLGVAPDASADEIRRAHRLLIKENHPDLFPEGSARDAAGARTRLLNDARDALTGDRAAYDASLKPPEPPEPPAAEEEPVDDPWSDAAPGTPTADPWAAAATGHRPPPQPPPPSRPPPTPPPPRTWAPPPPPPRPPLRRRQRGPGGVILLCVFLTVAGFAAAIAVIAVRSSPPDPKATVPAALTGSWRGKAKDDRDGTWEVLLTLRPGRTNGKVSYDDGTCLGTAVPVSFRAGALNIGTFFKNVSGCDRGNLTVKRRKDGRLDARYIKSGTAKPWATAVLTRQRMTA